MLPLIFYMLIVLLLVGGKQEKHKPIYYLAEWYLNKRHSLLLSHPVLFLIRLRSGQQACLLSRPKWKLIH